jgi:single-strand DNA-binding protein
LATTESYKDKNDTWQKITEWHSIVAWRNLAERAERDLKKGSSVFVEGKLSYRKYEKDGVEKYITEIVASTLNSLEKREKSANSVPQTDDSIPSGSDEGLPF